MANFDMAPIDMAPGVAYYGDHRWSAMDADPTEEEAMEKIIDLVTLAARTAELPGVQTARVWDRVPGKERIYVDLTKYNGGRNWNGGVGHRVIIHADRRVELDPRCEWAGAATFQRHKELGTLEAIEELVASA